MGAAKGVVEGGAEKSPGIGAAGFGTLSDEREQINSGSSGSAKDGGGVVSGSSGGKSKR